MSVDDGHIPIGPFEEKDMTVGKVRRWKNQIVRMWTALIDEERLEILETFETSEQAAWYYEQEWGLT